MSYWEGLGKSDEWYTPRYVFDAMGVTFDLDVAAPTNGPRHVPCRRWISEHSLSERWSGFVWMNPPFGGRNGLKPWLDRFFAHGNGIALVPDRTSAPWWQDAAGKAESVFFVAGKIRFEKPDGSQGKSPSNGTCLFGVGPHAARAFFNANSRGLGLVFSRQEWMRAAA
jgi:hypothetical protein